MAGSENRRTQAWTAACLLAGLTIVPCAAGDVLVLDSGRRVEVEQWWRDSDRVLYRKYGGTVGIPAASVIEILPGSDGSDELPAPPALRGYPGGQGTAAAAPAGAPAEVPPSDWEQDLRTLESRLRREPGARGEVEPRMAVLWTQAGNERYLQQDLPGALMAYETALGLDPSLQETRLNLASAYLSAGRSQQALREADQVLAEHPDAVDALMLRGEALYRVERLDAAIQAWTRAHELAPSPRTKERLEKAGRERAVGGDFLRSDAAHFTLRYDGAVTGAPVGQEVLDFLEGQFERLVQRYNHLPPSVIVVILYPAREFHGVTATPSWTGGVFDGKIRVPIGGLHGMTEALQRTLLHELTHSFVTSKTRGAASRWMQEGLAQYEEGHRPGRGTLLALARTYRSDGSRWGQGLDYPSSLALTDFLIRRYGFGALLQVLDEEGNGLSENQALRKVLGIDTEQMFRIWGDALLDGDT